MAGEVAFLLPLNFVSRAMELRVRSGEVFLFLVSLVPVRKKSFSFC